MLCYSYECYISGEGNTVITLLVWVIAKNPKIFMIKAYFLLLLHIHSGSEGRVVSVLGLCFILFSHGDSGWWRVHHLEIVGHYGGGEEDENDTSVLKCCPKEMSFYIRFIYQSHMDIFQDGLSLGEDNWILVSSSNAYSNCFHFL